MPKVKVQLTNRGGHLNEVWISTQAVPYQDDLAGAHNLEEGWRDAHNIPNLFAWKTNETRKFTIQVGGRALPSPGVYVVRLQIFNWIQQTKSQDELLKEIKGMKDDAEKVKEFVEREHLYAPFKNSAQFGPQRALIVYRGTFYEYFRVDSLPSVLSFWLVIGTVFIGIATVLLAIVALVT